MTLVALCLLTAAGCAVPQPRGKGKLTHEVEPSTRRGYYLYLPAAYVDDGGRAGRSWPTVVTFHGMKPWDNARPQAMEWQQEADRYGFVIVAPEMRSPDMLRQFPLSERTDAFKSDEVATIAILDRVFATTRADPRHVLSTSWSSGGYLAHYMANQYPERFSSLAVRQSNFSKEIQDPSKAAQGRHRPMLIVNTENDFGVCKSESREAVDWYQTNGYDHVAWVYLKSLGHERTPDIAAAFFAQVCGMRPQSSPAVIARRQAIDGNAEGLAILTGDWSGAGGPAYATAREPAPKPMPKARRTAPPRAREVAISPDRVQDRPIETTAAAKPVLRQVRVETPPPSPPALTIRVSSAIGIEPLYLGYFAECPIDWRRNARFEWFLNGQPIGVGLNGHKTLGAPGEHTLAVKVTTAEGERFEAERRVRVLPKLADVTRR
ncbi:MAG: hypothetical protein KDA32_04935 [Phycisphaerales bacterium]|nr:hypothetical protein [Phycisphaerales bacterium]